MIQIVKLDLPGPVGHAGRGDDRGVAVDQPGQQQVVEQEWRQVVHLVCQFMPVFGLGSVPGAQEPGIVHQDVDARALAQYLVGQAPDVVQASEIGDDGVRSQLLGDVVGLVRVPSGQYQLVPVGGELTGCRGADAVGCPSDDDGLRLHTSIQLHRTDMR